MLKLGEKQVLQGVKLVDFGVYLADPEDPEAGRVLLPKKQVPEGFSVGDELEVFLYKDSSDRLIATVNEPAMTLGKVALVKVAAVGKIGAFLDWGLEKDLFLPFHEQTRKVQEGDVILAALYIDKSGRLAATMKLYPYLETNAELFYRDQEVTGRVYQVDERFGAYVAVDGRYSGMIGPRENIRDLYPGEVVTCRITRVKRDGKLDLTLREKAYKQLGPDARKILELLDLYDGELPFNEKSDPETIMRETGMSKNAFKRAIGHLYKERKITIGEKIRRSPSDDSKES